MATNRSGLFESREFDMNCERDHSDEVLEVHLPLFVQDWLYQFLMNASADDDSDCIEPHFIRVLKNVAGPFEDGTVRYQVSDGDLFMDAVFSKDVIQSGILSVDSEVDWGRSTLLLKEYRVRHEAPTVNDGQNSEGQMVLVVNKCDLNSIDFDCILSAYTSSCLSRPKLREKLHRYCQKIQSSSSAAAAAAEDSSCRASQSTHLPVSQLLLMAETEMDVNKSHRTASPQVSHLMSEMSEEGTACLYQMRPLDLNNFLISHEDQLRLDSIEEWFSDFTPFEDRRTLPPTTTVHSDNVAIVEDDLSSRMHCQVAPPSSTTRPKTLLCDASVQVTLCQHDSRIQPKIIMVDAAVQVNSSSFQFNTQTHSIIQGTDNASQDTGLSIAFPCSSRPLPSVLAPSLQDFSFRDGTWSSGSSLRLSCDEEPNDLRPDPNREMLPQQGLPSSGSSKNTTTEDNSPPVSASAFKTTIPHSSRSTIVSSPAAWKIQATEKALNHDPVTTNILHCTDSERPDPINKGQISVGFNHSIQIDCLQSSPQHCLVQPDFPLSPLKRSEATGCASQLSDTFETVPVGDRMTDDSRSSIYRQNVSISHQIRKGSDQRMIASQSDVPNTSSTIAFTSLTLPCSAAAAAAAVVVSLSCSTKTTSVSMASMRTLFSDNQPQTKSQTSHQPDLVLHRTSSEAPHHSVFRLDSADTYKCITSEPVERNEFDVEMDSCDELIMSAACRNILSKQDLPHPTHSVRHPVTDSDQKQQLMTVSAHKTATGNDDDDEVVIARYEKPKSVERKIEKSSNPAKGSRPILRQNCDPMVLFSKRNLKKRLENRRHKLFNVDQKLEVISSSSSETDSNDVIDTHFVRSEKQQKTFHKKKPYCIPSGGKSRKTETEEKEVNMTARVLLEPLATGRQLGGIVKVTDRGRMQKTLSHEVAKEPGSGKDPLEKSIVIGVTGVRNSTFTGVELDKAARFKSSQSDIPETEHINRIAVRDTAKDGGRTTVGLDQVQTVPSEFTFAKGAVKRNRKTGALGRSNSQSSCKYLEVHGSNVARDKPSHLGITNIVNSQSNFRGVSGGVGNDARSSDDRDAVGTCIAVDAVDLSDDSSAINKPLSEESVLKQTVSKREVVRERKKGTARDTTSHHNNETDEKYRSSIEPIRSRSASKLQGSSKSGDLQDNKMLTLPPPKTLLPLCQPQKQSTLCDLQPQKQSVGASGLLSPVDSRPSSPKLNRDRIQMLLGRDKMTVDEGRALSSSHLSNNLMSWTYNYFRNQPS